MIGTYGVKRPADVNPSDIEVIILFSNNRNFGETQTINKFSGDEVITPVMSSTEIGGTGIEILGGLYNLKLPKEVFNKKGFYTIYIRPAQIRVKIEDCSELATYPDVKGLVFNVDNVPPAFISKFSNNGLDGYRIEYLNNDGTKIPNMYRIITSSFIVEPIQVNTANSSQKLIKYVYNNIGNMLFCTVTPNTAPSFKPTSTPFIGRKDQNIIITNTSFSPQIIELEMVGYDVETLAIALMGNQMKDVNKGIYTLFDFDGNIHTQYDLYEVKSGQNKSLYEVRRKRDVIDTSQNLNNL